MLARQVQSLQARQVQLARQGLRETLGRLEQRAPPAQLAQQVLSVRQVRQAMPELLGRQEPQA